MGYTSIVPSGGSTGNSLNLARRMGRVHDACGPLNGAVVLDGGCGDGAYAEVFSQFGARVFALDWFEANAAAASVRLGAAGAAFQGDLERLPFEDGLLDVVFLNEVLEHVPDDGAALREAHRVLRAGGRLVAFSPNRLFPFETHGADWRSSCRSISFKTPLLPYLPVRLGSRWINYRARNYWPWEFRKLIRAAGFDVDVASFQWQTFENTTGQGVTRGRIVSILRRLSALAERTPALRAFGVSNFVVATKR